MHLGFAKDQIQDFFGAGSTHNKTVPYINGKGGEGAYRQIVLMNTYELL
jgi:hypothetical protein